MIRSRLAPTPRSLADTPLYYQLSRSDDRIELERLLDRGAVRDIHDSIVRQAAELVETRRADTRFSRLELTTAAEALLGPSPHEYGTWVYFPWSGRLVHVLDEVEFEELRTSRNRNKITRAEQTALGRLRIGIVGLSVGHATAVTLALEGIGGAFRLADFDELALSNLNRLRAGVHELDDNKAILTARRIYELNPYARIELFTTGVNDDNIDVFMSGAGSLDLLIEECDDLAMKVRLREEARRLRIPVLMETSDRGVLDVERFDREPARPLFHGLAGELDSRSLRGLTAYDKVPTVLAILGEVSPRAAASLVDVETTLKTWPQLASAVALGSALNAEAARRIALGQFGTSGRFSVDLEHLVCDGRAVPTDERAEAEPIADASEPARVEAGPLGDAELQSIVRWAALAPSGGNAQPWQFVYHQRAGALEVWLAHERTTSSIDAAQRGSLVALGAAVENARLAAIHLGRTVSVELSADAVDRIATLRIGERGITGDSRDHDLGRHVESRVTARSTREEHALGIDLAASLCAIAEESGGRLDLMMDRARLRSLADVVAIGDKLRLLNPRLHDELIGELRWSETEVQHRRDGLDVRALELTPTEIAVMRMLRSSEVTKALREIEGGDGLEKGTRKAIAGAAAVGLLRRPGDRTRTAYVDGGRIMQRVWLWAEANGLGLHPMTGFLYWMQPASMLDERLAHFDAIGAGFTTREQRELRELRDAFLATFPSVDGPEILFFRVVRKREPHPRALRRTLANILTISP